MAKITALITTYKRPKLLKRALKSVLNQSYKDFKILISDDNSNDNSKEIINEYLQNDNRLTYYYHEKNIGEKANINYLLSNINTPYFSLIHDDDGIEENFYEKAIHILDSNPDISIVIFNTLAIDINGDLIQSVNLNGDISYYRGDKRVDAWSNGQIPITWTGMIFRKEVASLWAETDMRFDPGPDIKFLIRSFSRHNFCVVNEIGAFCTLQSNTISDNRVLYGVHLTAIGMARYLEVLFDENTSIYVKNWALIQISLAKKNNEFLNFSKRILKEYIKWTCDLFPSFDKSLENYFNYIDLEKKSKIKIIFYLLKINFIKNLIRLIFFNYYNDRRKKIKSIAMYDQNNNYKLLFKFIKENTF
jgi:glycosyltransferase involved in cell wall biosynthesis